MANRSFRRTYAQGLPNPYPITVLWQVWVENRNPAFYQTCWFLGNENFYANVDLYYGAGPYPDPSPSGPLKWEIAVEGGDFVGDLVQVGRWYQCAFIAWNDNGTKRHRFYYDIPNAGKLIARDNASVFNRPLSVGHEFCWGDAPWQHVRNYPNAKEQLKGRLRRLKIITAALSVADAMAEASADELVTAAGSSNVWYLNANPTPDDVRDKSGRGHDFFWFDSSARAGLHTF